MTKKILGPHTIHVKTIDGYVAVTLWHVATFEGDVPDVKSLLEDTRERMEKITKGISADVLFSDHFKIVQDTIGTVQFFGGLLRV